MFNTFNLLSPCHLFTAVPGGIIIELRRIKKRQKPISIASMLIVGACIATRRNQFKKFSIRKFT